MIKTFYVAVNEINIDLSIFKIADKRRIQKPVKHLRFPKIVCSKPFLKRAQS